MTVEDFEKIVQYWFDLKILGGGDQSDPPFDHSQADTSYLGMTGSSDLAGTALISAETKSLGCGLVIYSKENRRMLEILCYYDSPSMDPTSPYKVGPPCSSCQTGFLCDDGLCASVRASIRALFP